jgi:hypothetical protein
MNQRIYEILEKISLEDLIQTSAPIAISLLIAFITWFLKSSYDKYIEELKYLKQLEIALSLDNANLVSNDEFLDDWITSLKIDKLYSCLFRTYSMNKLDTYNFSNKDLTNKLVKLGFGLDGLDLDLRNMFQGYQNHSIKMLDKDCVTEWKEMNKNTLKQALIFKTNFKDAIQDTKELISLLRTYYKQKCFSFFKLISFLGISIFPIITEGKIKKEYNKIEKELNEKNK